MWNQISIQEAIERNNNLDSESFIRATSQLQYQFRERDISKEIQTDMRFTAKTALERIETFLKEHTQTQVQVKTNVLYILIFSLSEEWEF